MSFNPQKMANIILDECQCIEDKYDGYRNKIINAIVQILQFEKDHKVQKTDIIQKIKGVCVNTGNYKRETH